VAQGPGRQVTWMEVAAKNAGIRRGISGLGWAYAWAVARESLGHDPSVEEVADWWRQSHRTAYRNQAAFRKAFPTLETPQRIFEQPQAREAIRKGAQLGDRMDGKVTPGRTVPDLDIVRLGMQPAVL
jgi:hypothetical protein